MMWFILGLVIGFSIMPARRIYIDYKWYRNVRGYSIKCSFHYAINDVWRILCL